jgi:hypothetical protein
MAQFIHFPNRRPRRGAAAARAWFRLRKTFLALSERRQNA